MGGLSLLSPQSRVGIGSGPGAVPRSFGETFAAKSYSSMLQTPVTGQSVLVGNPLKERDALIQTRTGKPISELTGTAKKYTNPTAQGRIQQLEEDHNLIDNLILTGRKENPGLYEGVKTTAEIRDEAKKNASFAQGAAEEIAQDNPSPVSRTVASFSGSMAGTMTDVPNILTAPIGAPAGMIRAGGTGVAAQILKNAAAEGVLQAGIQAAQIPDMKEWQETLGNQYGFKEMALDVGSAAIGGAVLRGGGEAIAAGARKLAGTPSPVVFDKIAQNVPATHQSVKDSLKYMERTAYIDEATPAPVKNRRELAEHRQAVQKVADDIETYQRPAPDLPQTITPDRYAEKAVEILEQLKKYETTGNKDQAVEIKKALGYAPESLSSFIKRTGGIADTGGDLKAMGIDYKRLPGMIRKGQERQGADLMGGKIAEDATTQIDYVKQRAFDAGYFPEKSNYDEVSNDELLDAIARDLDGDRVYTIDDAEAIARVLGDRTLVDQYDQSGITSDMSPEDVAQRLRDIEQSDVPFDTNAYSMSEYRQSRVTPPTEIKPTDRLEASRTSFDALVKENPDMKVTLDDGKVVSLKEYAEELKASEGIIEALTTCRLS